MVDKKISDLTELTGAAYQEDVLEIVDTSATENKKIKASALLGPAAVEETGTSYTFALGDAFKTKIFNSSSAQTITIPTNASVAFPVGTRIRCFRKGSGSVKVVPDTGVTFNLPTGIRPNRFMGVKCTTAGQASQNYTSDKAVPFEATDEYDTDAFHDTATNNTRITLPSGLGITKVTLSGSFNTSSDASNSNSVAYFKKDNTTIVAIDNRYRGWPATEINLTAADISATSGYFELVGKSEYGTAVTITTGSFFSLSVSEIDAQGWIAYRYGSIEIEKVGTNEWIVVDQTALG